MCGQQEVGEWCIRKFSRILGQQDLPEWKQLASGE